jgi:dTDP-4-amino-4,6-dideoxygalactose transaminase
MSETPFVPSCRPTLEREESDSVVESLRSGWITTGPKALRFEELFRERLNVRHAVALPSVANSVELLVDQGTLQMDPGDVERRITPRTKAIVPVHFAGQPVETDTLPDARMPATRAR